MKVAEYNVRAPVMRPDILHFIDVSIHIGPNNQPSLSLASDRVHGKEKRRGENVEVELSKATYRGQKPK